MPVRACALTHSFMPTWSTWTLLPDTELPLVHFYSMLWIIMCCSGGGWARQANARSSAGLCEMWLSRFYRASFGHRARIMCSCAYGSKRWLVPGTPKIRKHLFQSLRKEKAPVVQLNEEEIKMTFRPTEPLPMSDYRRRWRKGRKEERNVVLFH